MINNQLPEQPKHFSKITNKYSKSIKLIILERDIEVFKDN